MHSTSAKAVSSHNANLFLLVLVLEATVLAPITALGCLPLSNMLQRTEMQSKKTF